MKTIICFENEELSCFSNNMILKNIRRLYPDDQIIMISAGEFSSSGTLMTPSCKKRAEMFINAGADLILSLPVSSILGGCGKKEFAGAALAQNLRIPELLIIIPFRHASGQMPDDCEEILRSCAMLMFGEKSGYRSRLSGYINKMPFREAQIRTVCECIPEAEKVLFYPENRQALWMLDAMMQLYYMAKVQFIAAPEIECSPDLNCSLKDHNDIFQKTAAFKIADLLETASREQLTDISGSTTQMVTALFDNKNEILNAGSFEEIVSFLAPEPPDRARLFLLKAILGIRKIHMQICGLHTYVPYCYVCAENQDMAGSISQLNESSWVPFIGNELQKQAVDKDYCYLLQADKIAGELIK